MSELNGSDVVKKSKFPKEVVEDWIRFDEAYFSIKGKHKFIWSLSAGKVPMAMRQLFKG